MNGRARPPMDRLATLAARVGGSLQGADAGFAAVSTDTRKLTPGDLFVALSGPNFDGHEFVRRAACLGAAGALVARPIDLALPQVRVADTLTALQAYAAARRRDFDLPVIAVTGSNGKTTVKQMLAAILRASGPVLATEGNLNNHIGVPLTLTRLRNEHRSAVIEMGANHAGEIEQLAALAAPTVGVVTLAAPAHLEGFGSVEGVARAKGELFAALPPTGTAVINADDAFAPLWRGLAAGCRRVEFGLAAGTDVSARADSIRLDELGRAEFELVTPAGSRQVRLSLPGRHQVMNALAAAAAAGAAGAGPDAIVAGLAAAQAAPGRLAWQRREDGVAVLDDSYNANPASLCAALELLSTHPGERWLVLGDMAELGTGAEAAHAAAGRLAKASGVSRVFALGPLSAATVAAFGAGARHFDEATELLHALRAALEAGVVPGILVKGSRSMRMERVTTALAGVAGKRKEA